jgi:hypothetical protein
MGASTREMKRYGCLTDHKCQGRWVLILGITTSLAACSIVGLDGDGSTCGGAQTAVARAALPDTGIAAGTELLLVLAQYDPFLIGEQTELVIDHLWPLARGPNLEPDPRVRLVRDDGRVLLDMLASRSVPNQIAGTSARSTWIVIQIIRSAERRNAILHALRDQKLSVELWRRDATQPGTQVRLRTEAAEVSPVTRCL